MRVILGIGNPGPSYDGSRHNLGFAVVDALARRHHLPGTTKKWNAQVVEWRGPHGPCLLVKPQTYVNLSGETAQAVCAFYKILPTNLLVVVDDIALPTGSLRLRENGSAGGHNGLKDIEARLGQGYHRLRCGCGPVPPGADQVGFVLGGFRPEEKPVAEAMVLRAADACEAWLAEGPVVACRFNGPARVPVANPPARGVVSPPHGAMMPRPPTPESP